MDRIKWTEITFGQSTDLNFSSTILPEKVGMNEARKVVIEIQDGEERLKQEAIMIESRGGKIGTSHDGLTFYYTPLATSQNFRLEADVYINQLGPEESTGNAPSLQEGAGLMVRDINGVPRKVPMMFGYEEVPAASNMIAVNIMAQQRTLHAPYKIQALVRKGVTKPWGNPGIMAVKLPKENNEDTLHTFSDQQHITTSEHKIYKRKDFFKLALERTNEGFLLSYGEEGQDNYRMQKISGADCVMVQDKDYMYVGFYASRNAKVTFTNVKLTTSKAETRLEEYRAPLEPLYFERACGDISTTREYILKAFTNYDGYMTLIQDDIIIAEKAVVKKGELFKYETILEDVETSFEMQLMNSDQKIMKVIPFKVEMKSGYAKRDLVVSQEGKSSGKGTIESPLDLETALEYLSDGYTIYLREGVYRALHIPVSLTASPDMRKGIRPYLEEKVIFDGEGKVLTSVIGASYWHLQGLSITGSTLTGMRVTGSGNLFEKCSFYSNGDTGFQMSALSTLMPSIWPKYNLVKYCESYNNRDASGINADGFAAKLGVGEGNYFYGCISHHNADDGWDLFNKIDGTANKPVGIERCIAYANGIVQGYEMPAIGSIGNGFKLGGEGLPVEHIIKDCIAFKNNMDGFSCNFNPGHIRVENCKALDNARSNFLFRSSPYVEAKCQGEFINNTSLRTDKNYPIKDFVSGNIYRSQFFI